METTAFEPQLYYFPKNQHCLLTKEISGYSGGEGFPLLPELCHMISPISPWGNIQNELSDFANQTHHFHLQGHLDKISFFFFFSLLRIMITWKPSCVHSESCMPISAVERGLSYLNGFCQPGTSSIYRELSARLPSHDLEITGGNLEVLGMIAP